MLDNINSKALLTVCLFLLTFVISCNNVNSFVQSNESELDGSDIVHKSISNKISIVTGLNHFDPTDERFKIHFRNISAEPVIISDIWFKGPNSDIYSIVDIVNNQCIIGDTIRPGGTCSVSVGAVSALSGLFTGDDLVVSFFSRVGGIGVFDIATPVESFILKSDSKLFMQSLVSGVSAYFYDFGRVPVGSFSSHTYKVFNTSGSTKSLHLVSQDSAFFRIMPSMLIDKKAIETGLSPCSTSLNDGEVCLVDVLYFPSIEESSQTSILTVSTEPGGVGSVAPLQVIGTGATQFEPSEVKTGTVVFDKNYLQFKKVVSVGSISDTAEVLTITNNGDNSTPFSIRHINETEYILSGSCTTTRDLSGNASCELSVRFRPREAKRSNDIIVVSTGDNNHTTIPILATASEPIPIEGLKYWYAISSRGANPPNSSYTAIDNITDILFPDNPKVNELANNSIYVRIENTKREKIFFSEKIESNSIFISGSNPNRCESSVAGSSSCIFRLDILPAKFGESFDVFSLESGIGSFILPITLNSVPDNITTNSFTINKPSLLFYDTEVGFSSNAEINVRNGSSVASPISIVMPNSDDVFRITTTCLGSGVPAESDCNVNVLFTPDKVDNFTSEVEINGVKIPITAKGVGAYRTDEATAVSGLSIDKKRYRFAPTEMDAVSKSAKFTLRATGQVKVKLTIPSYFRYEKDFSTCIVDSDNLLSLSAGTSCVIAFAFVPTSKGNVNDNIILTDSVDSNKTTRINLLGEVVSRNKVVLHGYTSAGSRKTETMTFYNNEHTPLKLGAVSLVGYSVAPDGTQTALFDSTFSMIFDGCSNTVLEPLKSCDMDISFNPLVDGKYIGKADVTIEGRPTKRLITVGSTINHEFVPIIPESSYQALGRPEQSMITFNNKVYALGGNYQSHEENNTLKVLDMQSMLWSKVSIDTATEEFAPYASYVPTNISPTSLMPIVPFDSVSIRSVKFDIYDGELAVVGGYLSEIPDITSSTSIPAYKHAKTNWISFIDLKTGKWSAPRRMHEFYANLSQNGGPGNTVASEIDRIWGDVSRVGTSYYHTGGQTFGRGMSVKWGQTKLSYYDFAQDNKSFMHSPTSADYNRGMGVSTLSTGRALLYYQPITNLGTDALGNNYERNNGVTFSVSRLECSSAGWQAFTSTNSVARLISGSLPRGNRFSTDYFRSKSTKVHNVFLGTGFNSQDVYRIAVTEISDTNPCSIYSATVKAYKKSQTAVPSTVFAYDDKLWIISDNLIQVLVTTDF